MNLIEHLEKLPRFNIFKLGISAAMVEQWNGQYVNIEDLLAITEQHKQEADEPVEYQIKILGERWTRCAKHIYDPNNPNTRALYTTPQPDIVSELVEAFEHSRACLEAANNSGLINDTLWAGNAETLLDYMDAAIAKAKEMMG